MPPKNKLHRVSANQNVEFSGTIAPRRTSPLGEVETRLGVSGEGEFAELHASSNAIVPQPQKIRIHTPIIRMTKAQIIREGLRLGVDYSMTISCYDPSPEGKPCGHCDSCQLRAKGVAENGMVEG